MSLCFRSGLALLLVASVGSVAVAQAPPAAKTQTKPATKPAQPKADPVLATVNGEPIMESEVVGLLSQFAIPPGKEQEAYQTAMDLLVNTRVLSQFLKAQKVEVAPAEIDEVVAQYEKNMKANDSDLATELANNGTSMDEFKSRIARTLQWKKYVMQQATDDVLKKYAEANKDVFNGSQVRASHILIKLDPDASQEKKEEAKKKLQAIKQQIESGQISFADAANKYSEDPGNVQTPSGGDLGLFPRKGQYIEEFSEVAFGLKKGEISNPIETEYGYHLIHVTDRKEGQPIDFAQFKDQILNQYAFELQKQIAEQQRAKAKVEIKPMPASLAAKLSAPVPSLPPGSLTPPPAGAATPKAATTTPKPAAPKTATPKPVAPKAAPRP